MVAIGTLLVVMTASLLVTRVATVILVATGMSSASARFQARSAFTGTGFTTTEAEDVVGHPVRRKVVMWLMLLGNAGLVAAAGSLILGFRSNGGVGGTLLRAVELAAGMLALLYLSRSRWVDQRLTRAIGAALQRWSDLPEQDTVTLLQLADGYQVAELAVRDGDWLAGCALGRLRLRDEGVAVLGVRAPDGGYTGVPGGDTVLSAGDVLVLYGHAERLAAVDRRRSGPAGDDEHRASAQQRTT